MKDPKNKKEEFQHRRKVPRNRTPGKWARILREGSSQGIVMVRLWDISLLGLSFESLEKRPFQIGDRILIVDTSELEQKNIWSVVRHISIRKSEDDLEVFGIGVEFETDQRVT